MRSYILPVILCVFFAFLRADSKPRYNADKTWKNIESKAVLDSKKAKLEGYYKQVDKQSRQKNFVRFNGKKIISHGYFSHASLKEIHELSTYIILSRFYIKSISPHNDLDGITVSGILSEEADDRKAKVRYFKFAQRYYTALNELGVGSEAYSYCAAPYLTSCILIGIAEKW